MAQRRMFSKDITGADAFLDMPSSSQLLYFQLGMEADDDGFVGSPKKVSRIIGSGEDDLKVLIGKRFLLSFETGVVVIKHWGINNLIRKDRYSKTKYLTEKSLLQVKENGSYTEWQPNGNQRLTKTQPNGNQRLTKTQPTVNPVKVRLGKVSIVKDNLGSSEDEPKKEKITIKKKPIKKKLLEKLKEPNQTNRLMELFRGVNPTINKLFAHKTQRDAIERLVSKFGEEKVESTIKSLKSIVTQKYAPRITTPLQLESKLGDLIIFYKQQQPNQSTHIKIN